MKKLFFFAITLSVSALAADSLDERVDALQSQFDRAMSKAGIHFSGEFRSQFLSSTVSENAVQQDAKKNESVEYTSVDFDISARPNAALSARAVFRLHQDWRNFFSDVQNPITTRWLSIDGSIMQGMVKYSLGDYKKKVSQLTLWSPDMEFLYEPEIFAMQRRFAISESFLGDNNRLLQGMDLAFKAQLYPLLEEVEAGVFGARLASTGNGETGVLPETATASEFDKYLIGVNAGTQIFKGLGLGITNITIFDHETSFGGIEKSAKLNSESNNVFAARLNADNRTFMETGFVQFGVNAEFALSSHKSSYLDFVTDEVVDTTVSGNALNAELFGRLTFDEGNTLKLSGTFINNEAAFRNDAAQSPVFFQRAIMNSENKTGLGAANPFDALYRTVFKYAPSQYLGGAIKPRTKTAYNIAIVSPSAYSIYDLSVFQMSMPGGLASADRTGPIAKLDGSFFDKGLSVGLKAAMLKSVEEHLTYDKDYNLTAVKGNQEFLDFAGGASVDIAKFVPAVGPSLVLGGSLAMYNASHGDWSTDNTLISAELNYNFYKRFSLLGGLQMLATQSKYDGKEDWPETVFTNLAVGLQYKVADGGCLTVKFNRVGAEQAEFEGMPKVSYKAVQPEVFLTVTF
jgi:hypothetical protein